MDVISTIKVRNADGTYSDFMPIGTVSDYITIAADGSSLSSILGNVNLNKYGSLQSQINALGGGTGVADGVCYVGEDPEDTGEIPIEKINGIAFDANGDVLKAYWEGETGIVEAQLAPIEGGGGGEVPEGVTYVTLGDDDDETIDGVVDGGSGGTGNSGFNEIYAENSINLGRALNSDIGEQSVAIGSENLVVGINSIAVGKNNIIDETQFSGTYDYASDSIIVGYSNTINTTMPAAIFGWGNSISTPLGNYASSSGGSIIAGGRNIVQGNFRNAVFGHDNKIYKDEENNNDTYDTLVAGYGNEVYGALIGICLGNENEIGKADNNYVPIAIGRYNLSTGKASVALGSYCEAIGDESICMGYECKSTVNGSEGVAAGVKSEIGGQAAMAFGGWCKALGNNAIAMGYNAEATSYTSIAMGYQAKTEGSEGVAIGSYSEASGGQSLALGYRVATTAYNAIGIGYYNEATASQSLALGAYSIASGNNSITLGYFARAAGKHQTAMGKYNVEDTENKYALIFGGGEYDAPKNIFTLDWNGSAWFNGAILNKNGEDVSGIDVTSNSTFTSLLGGKAALTVLSKYEQKNLKGISLYKFEDYSVTQNGVTMTIKDNVLSWSGTPTITTNGTVIFEDYLDEIDLSILTNNYYIYAKGTSFIFDVYDLEGNVLQSNATKYLYDSATVGKIIPHIRREYWYEFNPGSSVIMFCQSPENVGTSSFISEPYVGGAPSPNPNYPQVMNFPSFSMITLKNESGNTVIDFGEEVTLYSAINVADIINSTSIVRNVAKIILTGTEEISGDAAAGYFTYTPSALGKANSINVLSDHYRNVNGNLSETDYNIFIDANGNIRIQHSGFTSVDAYKTWLASNNVIIVYERAEAEVVALSSEVSAVLKNLEIYSGETTITVDSETIQPIIKVEYPTSLVGKYVLELKNNNGSSNGGSGDNSNVDLSSVVPNTRKIAGIDLENDITVEELANALRVAQGELHVDFEDAESTDASVSTNKATNYSLEEQCIGTWIDDKPLYQKTFIYENISVTESTLYLETDLTDIDFIFIFNGQIIHPSGNTMCLPYCHSNATNNIGVFVSGDGSGFNFRIGSSNLSQTYPKILMTVQYTKTTDEV